MKVKLQCSNIASIIGCSIEENTEKHLHRIVEAAGLAAVRIGNAGLIAHGVIGVGNRIALVVGHPLEAAQQVQLEGVGASLVIHLHQFADLVILVGDLLCPIVIDFLHQIKGGVGIPGHIAIRVGLGDQIAVAVVDINGAVAVVIPYQGQKGYQLNTLIPLLLHFIWCSSMLL